MSLSAISLPRKKGDFFFIYFLTMKTTALTATQNSFKSALCNVSFILLIKSIQSTAGATGTKIGRYVELNLSGLKTILIVKDQDEVYPFPHYPNKAWPPAGLSVLPVSSWSWPSPEAGCWHSLGSGRQLLCSSWLYCAEAEFKLFKGWRLFSCKNFKLAYVCIMLRLLPQASCVWQNPCPSHLA